MMPLANILELFLDCTTDPHIVGRQDTVALAATPVRPMSLQEALGLLQQRCGRGPAAGADTPREPCVADHRATQRIRRQQHDLELRPRSKRREL